MDRDIEGLMRRLADKTFLEKADAEVIEKSRERHDTARQERDRLAEALALL